jgi:hypothetical protein
MYCKKVKAEIRKEERKEKKKREITELRKDLPYLHIQNK